jgi:hypothetical protein
MAQGEDKDTDRARVIKNQNCKKERGKRKREIECKDNRTQLVLLLFLQG